MASAYGGDNMHYASVNDRVARIHARQIAWRSTDESLKNSHVHDTACFTRMSRCAEWQRVRQISINWITPDLLIVMRAAQRPLLTQVDSLRWTI